MHKRVVGSSMTVFGPPHLLSPQAQQFHAWKKEFSVFQQKLYFQEGQNFTNLAVKAYEVELTVLRIWELLGDILFTIDALQGQFHWEEFTGHFAKIVDLSGYVLRQDRSLIALLGEILQMAGNRCRDRLVQSRAILLLGTHPYRDGIFDSVFAARCATAKAKLEQQGIAMEQRGSSCECKFDSMSICDDHRIVSVTKQSFSQTHNQVTLRMKTAYEVRQGLSGTLINIAHSSS
ncbi:hypothetical protein QQS21_000582 [Conoideocrella luteorostrata]|uniref:Uncharacterized protein n=1 Tax=Conoideocrella luteorostrata TaxID=1105319 RepID=A0AAJ0CYR2_9HYPO|nr:hypothetical protein QQS21_000582 [Conoideocrella luteorostrata]